MNNENQNVHTNQPAIGDALDDLNAIINKIHAKDETETVHTNKTENETHQKPKVQKQKPIKMHLKPAKQELESSDDVIIFKKGRTDRISMRVTPAEKKALNYLADFHDLNLTNYLIWLAKQDAKRRRLVNRIKEEGGDLD